ncbi:MAG: sugar nucleotide-binding protein, partial [Pseudomonadota bacterium]
GGSLRTSGLFGAEGRNFFTTMRRLARERRELEIVNDQVVGPTLATDLARAIFVISRRLHAGTGEFGTYHFGSGPPITWAQFAEDIFASYLPPSTRPRVNRISSEMYGAPAKRPTYSALDSRKIAQSYHLVPKDWRDGLHAIATDKARTYRAA